MLKLFNLYDLYSKKVKYFQSSSLAIFYFFFLNFSCAITVKLNLFDYVI